MIKYPVLTKDGWVWYRGFESWPDVEKHREKLIKENPELIYGFYKSEKGPDKVDVHDACSKRYHTTNCSHNLPVWKCNICAE